MLFLCDSDTWIVPRVLVCCWLTIRWARQDEIQRTRQVNFIGQILTKFITFIYLFIFLRWAQSLQLTRCVLNGYPRPIVFTLNSLHAFFLSFMGFLLKSNFFKEILQEYHQSVKQFGSRSGPTFCWAWSGSKLFAKVISRRQKSPPAGKDWEAWENFLPCWSTYSEYPQHMFSWRYMKNN